MENSEKREAQHPARKPGISIIFASGLNRSMKGRFVPILSPMALRLARSNHAMVQRGKALRSISQIQKVIWLSLKVPQLPNPPLNSDLAGIAFRSFSASRFLGSAHRPGAGGAG